MKKFHPASMEATKRPSTVTRRTFLQGLGLSTLGALLPQFALAKSIGFSRKRRLLLLVELKGGNDGLNTLVAYTDPAYYAARPTLALEKAKLAVLDEQWGMHPQLAPLMPAWRDGELGWVQGVGHSSLRRSHFESTELWDSALMTGEQTYSGWVARCFPQYELGGIAVATNPGPLYGADFSALTLVDKPAAKQAQAAKAARRTNSALQHVMKVQAEVEMMAAALASELGAVPQAHVAFADNAFERNLESVYTLVASGINVPAYKVTLDGFDTHKAQAETHGVLLATLAQGLAKLRTNLQQIAMWDELMIMTYSEFGRSVAENVEHGTGHGTAAPHLVLGGKVEGGLYGNMPSLTDLDERGEMYYTTDLRDVYATVKRDWWGLDVGGNRRSLGFIG